MVLVMIRSIDLPFFFIPPSRVHHTRPWQKNRPPKHCVSRTPIDQTLMRLRPKRATQKCLNRMAALEVLSQNLNNQSITLQSGMGPI